MRYLVPKKNTLHTITFFSIKLVPLTLNALAFESISQRSSAFRHSLPGLPQQHAVEPGQSPPEKVAERLDLQLPGPCILLDTQLREAILFRPRRLRPSPRVARSRRRELRGPTADQLVDRCTAPCRTEFASEIAVISHRAKKPRSPIAS